MTTYTILYTIPHNYTARELVYMIKHAKSNPNASYITTRGWGNLMTADQLVRWFRRCLHEKINHADGQTDGSFRGPFRKLSTVYQRALYRDSFRLKGYGGFGKILETPEIRVRLGADHVHTYVNGRHSLCSDPHCETRR